MTLDFTADYVLENDRVLLRPLTAGDLEHLLPYAINEPEIWRYNAWGGNGAANMRSYFERALQHRKEGKEYPFIVYDKRTQRYAGSTRFYDYLPERNTIVLGYTWYGKDFQGTGLNKNCKYLLLDFAFEQLGLERVGFFANAENAPSLNAMRSIGCVREGTMRSQGIDTAGKRVDVAVLSILRSEWQDGGKDRLYKKITDDLVTNIRQAEGIIEYKMAGMEDIDLLTDMRIQFSNALIGVQEQEKEAWLRTGSIDYFREALNTSYLSWYAKVDGVVAAVAGVVLRTMPGTISNPSGKWGYIMNVYTLPEYRNIGLAEELMKRLLASAKEKGVTAFELHATQQGMPLYQRIGFNVHPEPTLRLFL